MTTRIEIRCACGKTYRVARSKFGRKGTCGRCGGRIAVEAAPDQPGSPGLRGRRIAAVAALPALAAIAALAIGLAGGDPSKSTGVGSSAAPAPAPANETGLEDPADPAGSEEEGSDVAILYARASRRMIDDLDFPVPEGAPPLWDTSQDLLGGSRPYDASFDGWIDANREALETFDRASRLEPYFWGDADSVDAASGVDRLSRTRIASSLRDAARGRPDEALEGGLRVLGAARQLLGGGGGWDFLLHGHVVVGRGVKGILLVLQDLPADSPLFASLAAELARLPKDLVDWERALLADRRMLAREFRRTSASHEDVSLDDPVARAFLGMAGLDTPEATKRDWWLEGQKGSILAIDRFREVVRRPVPEALQALNEMAIGAASAHPLTRATLESMPDTYRCGLAASARVDLLRTLLLVLEHRARVGTPPATLDGLGAPTDPLTGRPFALRQEEDAIVVESEALEMDGRPLRLEFRPGGGR